MAEKKKAEKEPAAQGGGNGKLIIILLVVLILLLLAGGGGAAYYFLIHKQPTVEAGEGETEAATETAAAPAPASIPEAAPAPAVAAPLLYHPLEDLTVNLPSGPARFLRVSLIVATPNPAVITALDKHMPMLRNDILAILAAQQFEVLNTPEGKDTLREALRQKLVQLLARASEPADVRDVLFNELIMQ
ncbi:flagellar FliL protein [Allochromatium warmingii]|uniref:Flagellar protein FliL n=1 Tax=Allochromatium warmingii TaxID=61595 RepID=A0A1H3JZ22_ALLWA|nr:flagellar basal body-associated FliL family protein [Allochromatium warmingii]SDY45210.1 flagellar FliL protein [Allochromatium warmingii]